MSFMKTVESRVLSILRENEAARYNDMLLAELYYEKFCDRITDDTSFREAILRYREWGMPCFESIRRARQRVQSCCPEVSRVAKDNVCVISFAINFNDYGYEISGNRDDSELLGIAVCETTGGDCDA